MRQIPKEIVDGKITYDLGVLSREQRVLMEKLLSDKDTLALIFNLDKFILERSHRQLQKAITQTNFSRTRKRLKKHQGDSVSFRNLKLSEDKKRKKIGAQSNSQSNPDSVFDMSKKRKRSDEPVLLSKGKAKTKRAKTAGKKTTTPSKTLSKQTRPYFKTTAYSVDIVKLKETLDREKSQLNQAYNGKNWKSLKQRYRYSLSRFVENVLSYFKTEYEKSSNKVKALEDMMLTGIPNRSTDTSDLDFSSYQGVLQIIVEYKSRDIEDTDFEAFQLSLVEQYLKFFKKHKAKDCDKLVRVSASSEDESKYFTYDEEQFYEYTLLQSAIDTFNGTLFQFLLDQPGLVELRSTDGNYHISVVLDHLNSLLLERYKKCLADQLATTIGSFRKRKIEINQEHYINLLPKVDFLTDDQKKSILAMIKHSSSVSATHQSIYHVGNFDYSQTHQTSSEDNACFFHATSGVLDESAKIFRVDNCSQTRATKVAQFKSIFLKGNN